MEEFIDGTICSFDGLTDRDGNLVFYTAHQYSQGIMETVNNDSLIYYYSLREIPPTWRALAELSCALLMCGNASSTSNSFAGRANNQIVALEVNMRPPGGMTTDMFNYRQRHRYLPGMGECHRPQPFHTPIIPRKYHSCYIGRKFNRSYAHSHEQILATFSHQIVHHEPVSGIFSAALGDYGYLIRSPDLAEVYEIVDYIHTPRLNRLLGVISVNIEYHKWWSESLRPGNGVKSLRSSRQASHGFPSARGTVLRIRGFRDGPVLYRS